MASSLTLPVWLSVETHRRLAAYAEANQVPPERLDEAVDGLVNDALDQIAEQNWRGPFDLEAAAVAHLLHDCGAHLDQRMQQWQAGLVTLEDVDHILAGKVV